MWSQSKMSFCLNPRGSFERHPATSNLTLRWGTRLSSLGISQLLTEVCWVVLCTLKWGSSCLARGNSLDKGPAWVVNSKHLWRLKDGHTGRWKGSLHQHHPYNRSAVCLRFCTPEQLSVMLIWLVQGPHFEWQEIDCFVFRFFHLLSFPCIPFTFLSFILPVSNYADSMSDLQTSL